MHSLQKTMLLTDQIAKCPWTERDVLKEIMTVRCDMLLDFPFFGSLAVLLYAKVDFTCDTAWTDGHWLAVNPYWFMPLTRAQKKGLVAHEVMHNAHGHPWRRGTRQPKRFNVACDFAIDPDIIASGMELPPAGPQYPNGHINPDWSGKSAEEIYALIPDGDDGGGGGDGDSGEPGDDPNDPNAPGRDVRDADKADTKKMGEGEWKLRTIEAAMHAKAAGNLPGCLEKFIDALKKSKVPWRALMQQWLMDRAKEDYSWRKPNKRYVGMGLYMPELRSETMPPVMLASDESSSISDENREATGSEMASFAAQVKPEVLHAVYWNVGVRAHDEFYPGDAFTLRPRGHGGTDVRTLFDYIERNDIQLACAVILTDLETPFPETPPDFPVLWISVNRNYTAPFGDVIYIDE